VKTVVPRRGLTAGGWVALAFTVGATIPVDGGTDFF
jgi:hypothetical protein